MTNNEDNVLQKLTKIIENYSKFPRSDIATIIINYDQQ